jgi:hypothetical protein
MAVRAVRVSRRAGGLLALLIVAALSERIAVAQVQGSEASVTPAKSLESLGSALSHILRSQARAALERHLRPEEFQIFVKATAADAPADPVPYLPATLAPVVPGPDTPPEDLAPLLQHVEVEVLIADRYDQTARAKLEAIIRKTLALSDARGDKVTFSPLGLKFDPPESAVQLDLARSEAEARDLKTRLDTLNRERDDAKRDLSATKVELDRVSREKAAREKPAGKDGHEGPSQSSTSSSPVDRGFLRENAAPLLGALLILAALLAASLGMRGAARTIGAAVQTIGAGLPVLGEKLGESMVQKATPLIPSPESGARPPDAKPAGDRPAVAGATLPMESVARRVIELHEELLASVDDTTEGLVLEHLSNLLEGDATAGLAVATMELLGKDKANALYDRLAPDHQQMVYAFLRSGVHSRPKGEVMLEAGESLKTKLFGAAFSPRAQLDDAIRQKLLLLKPEDIATAARSLEGDYLARLFAYLEPARLGGVLTALRAKDASKFIKAGLLVAKIPEVQSDRDLDQEVAIAIEEQLVRSNSDIQGPYLSYYKSLVQSVDDDVAESLSEQLAAASPRIEHYIREAVVTFGTFFKLHADYQEEIVLGFNTRDLAAVVAALKDDLKNAIYTHLDDRRKELVNEEVERLIAKGTRPVAMAHRTAKRQVVTRILQLKGSGPLSEMLVKPTAGLPEAQRPTSSAA